MGGGINRNKTRRSYTLPVPDSGPREIETSFQEFDTAGEFH